MKRSSSWIAVLPSLVIPICIGLMLYLGLSYLINEGQISNETVLRYLTGHPVSKVTVGMFFIGIASLGLIANNIFEQFSGEKKISISVPQGAVGSSPVQASEASEGGKPRGVIEERTVVLGKHLLDLPKWMHDHYLWQRLVNALHCIYRTNSTASVEDELKYLADLDLDRQQQRYSLVRILIWATPMLGFLGTVLGISQALGGINVGPDNDFQQMMDGLRGSLYVAFDTTALALTLSMVLMFGQFLVERFETQLLELVDQRAKQEINANFDMTVAPVQPTYENVAHNFLNASQQSIEQQTTNWQKTIQAAHATWLESQENLKDRLSQQLMDSIEHSVEKLTLGLTSSIDKADESMSHRWSQWQVTLSDNARLMSDYQGKLAQQAELMGELLAQDRSQQSLEPILAQNRMAAEATEKLKDAVEAMVVRLTENRHEMLDAATPSSETINEAHREELELAQSWVGKTEIKKQIAEITQHGMGSRIDLEKAHVPREPVFANSVSSTAEVILPVRNQERRFVTVNIDRSSKRTA
ncbi:MotA/TolQ/ExbB proton channel family protein [Mariniblastus sp.]|nr:MotA/TolQ/ExbB proton channel family protein [Mariniblastus sp.]MDA7878963.1 MotA/TolQ/ExbB proton channel family protein [bacterium]MDA7924187.1 MotA/TolQ/ExbB proton channel family protein [Mariniblastus sp.]MDB4380225.1 MotA/TolQ/ExbB proton channel family protein [Mariniblastus sp.]MDB4460323.1 MotA/TolQ/ExbB proton channel family protein [bacterium]